MNRILKEDTTISITDSRKIVDTRNHIIHGYDNISADILWSIVIKHLGGVDILGDKMRVMH